MSGNNIIHHSNMRDIRSTPIWTFDVRKRSLACTVRKIFQGLISERLRIFHRQKTKMGQ